MPEFICVQCFQCCTFQNQQVKKTNNFACRMCHARQTVGKVYAISGSAKDIRGVVMELNSKQGMQVELQDDGESRLQAGHATDAEPAAQARPGQWQEFVSQEDSLAPDPDGNNTYDTQTATYVTNIPDQQRQKRKGQHSQSEAANPAAATLRQPLVPTQPHRLARKSFSAAKPVLDSQAEAQNAWRHVKHRAGPTPQHYIVTPTDALPDRALQQNVVDSNKQRPFLDKPMATKKPKHTTGPAASRWSDFIPVGAADHVQHTSIAGNSYATCVDPEADEETGFITCLD